VAATTLTKAVKSAAYEIGIVSSGDGSGSSFAFYHDNAAVTVGVGNDDNANAGDANDDNGSGGNGIGGDGNADNDGGVAAAVWQHDSLPWSVMLVVANHVLDLPTPLTDADTLASMLGE
jgi:hypothetical protein